MRNIMKLTYSRFIIQIFLIALSMNSVQAMDTAFGVKIKEDYFKTLWQAIREQSYQLKSDKYQTQALESQVSRQSKHHFPTVMLSGQVYGTQEAGTHLFSLLSEKKMMMSDFDPQVLNQPSLDWYQKMGLQARWAVYEGGRQQSLLKFYQNNLEAQNDFMSAQVLMEYQNLFKNYGALMIQSDYLMQVSLLLEEASTYLQQYRLGQKSNPLGYSGWLALRGVIQEAKLNQLQVRREFEVSKNWILEKTQTHADQLMSSIDNEIKNPSYLKQFTQEKISSLESKDGERSVSWNQQILLKKIQAQEDWIEVKKSKNLPQLGLFTELSLLRGQRGLGFGFTGGAYVQWSLLNLQEAGESNQARFEQLSLEALMSKADQDERLHGQNLSQSIQFSEQQLELLLSSQEILKEQSRQFKSMYRQGIINLLQVSEIYKKSLELLQAKKNLQFQYLQTHHDYLSLSGVRL
jgi:outer membrane protein TolC